MRLSPPLSTSTRSRSGNSRLELLDRVEVRRDVVADRGVRAGAGLHGADPLVGQHARATQEVGVLGRVDVVGDDADRQLGAPACGTARRRARSCRCRPGRRCRCGRTRSAGRLAPCSWAWSASLWCGGRSRSGRKETHLRSVMDVGEQVEERRAVGRQRSGRSGRLGGTEVAELGGEPGQHAVHRERIEAEQADRGAGRRGDRGQRGGLRRPGRACRRRARRRGRARSGGAAARRPSGSAAVGEHRAQQPAQPAAELPRRGRIASDGSRASYSASSSSQSGGRGLAGGRRRRRRRPGPTCAAGRGRTPRRRRGRAPARPSPPAPCRRSARAPGRRARVEQQQQERVHQNRK